MLLARAFRGFVRRACPNRCGIVPQFAVLCFLPLLLSASDSANPTLTLRVASETAPTGGWTQIKVYAATPQSISQGAISMDFDPAVFGDIAGVAAFSAAGDAIGYASVQGQHVDAHFKAISGGIGQLSDLPIFTVRIAVLPGVMAGTKTMLTLDATGADWTGPQNNVYSVTIVPGEFTIGGTLFVKNITPGGGLLPSGTVVRIEGAGFDAGTALSAEGIAMSPLRVFGSQEMDFTLAGSIELTGMRFHLRNSAGEETDFFPALPSVPDGIPPQGTNPHVMIPLRTHTATALGMAEGIRSQFVGLLNQTTEPVDIRVLTTTNVILPVSSSVITIPPGVLQYEDVNADGLGTTWFISSVPIRMIQYAQPVDVPQSFVTEPTVETPPPALPLSLPPSIVWNWQTGTAAPIPQTILISSPGSSGGFTASVSGGDWLTITPTQTTMPAVLTVTANPQSLGPGTYAATITVTPIVPASLAGFTAQPSVIAVTLNVSSQQLLYATFGSTSFSLLGGQLTHPLTGTITTNGNPVPFTVTASTSSGGPWLSVTSSSAITPAQLTLSADPTGLAPENYSGTLTIVGAGNTLTVPVSFRIFPAVLPIQYNGQPPAFIREAGAPEPPSGATEFIVSPANGTVTVAYQTDTGGDWLHTQLFVIAGSAIVTVSVTSSGVAPGTYHGAVTVRSSVNGSVRVPVTLTVVTKPVDPPTVTPTSISITTSAGVMSDIQTLTAHSSTEPDLVNITAAGARGLSLSPASPNSIGLSPETVNISGTQQLPGAYFGTIVVSNSAGSVTVPTSLYVTASPAVPPVLGAVVNGASMRRGSLAPGEIIVVFGSGIGPAPASLELDSGGKVSSSLSGTQLLINGIPAPMIYASVGQLTAVVPYEVGHPARQRFRRC